MRIVKGTVARGFGAAYENIDRNTKAHCDAPRYYRTCPNAVRESVMLS